MPEPCAGPSTCSPWDTRQLWWISVRSDWSAVMVSHRPGVLWCALGALWMLWHRLRDGGEYAQSRVLAATTRIRRYCTAVVYCIASAWAFALMLAALTAIAMFRPTTLTTFVQAK